MASITTKEFERLAAFIKAKYGIHLKQEKTALLTGRLNQLLHQRKISSFSDYCEYVESDRTGEALTGLVNKITTNHTYFMREPEHLYFFRDHVVPVLERTAEGRDLRVWSAGCSTGEEAYTLAMILQDYFLKKRPSWDTKVLATDISSRVLDIAGQGSYSQEQLARLPEHWRRLYFQPNGGGREAVTERLKSEVIFRKLNLIEPSFPFKRRFHVIFCRNVMIYFDRSTREELVAKLAGLLEPGGYLFIGHSESLNGHRNDLKYVMPAVYQKGG